MWLPLVSTLSLCGGQHNDCNILWTTLSAVDIVFHIMLVWICCVLFCFRYISLQWRHNGHDSVPNHQPHDCLLNHLFRRRSKKTSKLRVTGLRAGNSPGTGELPRTNGQLRGKCFHLMTSSYSSWCRCLWFIYPYSSGLLRWHGLSDMGFPFTNMGKL